LLPGLEIYFRVTIEAGALPAQKKKKKKRMTRKK
jgi:hypothetical protein